MIGALVVFLVGFLLVAFLIAELVPVHIAAPVVEDYTSFTEDDLTPPETPIPKMLAEMSPDHRPSESDMERMMREYTEAKRLSYRVSPAPTEKKK